MSSGETPSSGSHKLDRETLLTVRVKELRRLADKLGIELRKKRMSKGELIQVLLDDSDRDNSAPKASSRRPHKGPRNASLRKTVSGRRAQELRMACANVAQSNLTHPNAMTAWSWSLQVVLLLKESGKEVSTAQAVQVRVIERDMSTESVNPVSNSEFVANRGLPDRNPSEPTTALSSASTPPALCVLPELLVPQSQTTSSPPLGSNLASTTTAPIPIMTDVTYSITLARGLQLHYSESDLRQPSSLQGLVSRPDVLHSFWDDSSPTWNPNDCPLVIRGVSIAIKHWNKFYSNFKRKKVWEEIKQNWNNFKVLMKEYESLGKVEFESRWFKNGESIPSHRIIQELRDRSRNQDKELAELARQNYPGDLFSKHFSYRKNGNNLVLTDTHSIANRYTRLLEVVSAAEGVHY